MIASSVVSKKLERQHDYVALVLVNPARYQEASMAIVKNFTNKRGMPGVYLSVNKPVSVLNEAFKKAGIRNELIIFIDAITNIESNMIEEENCYYLESPEHLSDISIAISQAIEAIDHKEKFIFIDSLSTLLIYNNPDTIVKFIHFLIGKMRAWNVTGIIMSLKKRGESGIVAEVSQFCDMTIEL